MQEHKTAMVQCTWCSVLHTAQQAAIIPSHDQTIADCSVQCTIMTMFLMGKKQQMLQERHPRSAAPRSRPKPELIIQDQYQHKDLDFQDQDFDQDSKKLSLETC